MKPRLLLSFCLVFAAAGTVAADPPSLLRMFRMSPRVEADESKSYELSEEDGPWMILASTLVGEGARGRAQRLALEIRSDLGLPAFIYNEKFDFTGNVRFDQQTAKPARYANRYQYEAYAVLVGEYDRVEHPSIDRDLQRIKTAKPAVLQDPNEMAAETSNINPVTTIKAVVNKLKSISPDQHEGPMGNAFVTRNPMLPEEYFQAPPVDSFVHQLNEGLEFSLLECDGEFTVVVKTFEGLGTIVDGKRDKKFEPSVKRMAKFAEDAAKMTRALRAKGVEAYQFHDRNRSLVTVGSFASLGRQLPGGKFEYAPQIRQVVSEYSALNVEPALARQVPTGTKGMASKNIALIPFDVHPTPIKVPKLSKRSLYGAALGMR